MAIRLSRSSFNYPRTLGCSTKNVGTGVDWVSEYQQYRMVSRILPLNPSAQLALPHDRQLKACLHSPQQNLTHTP
jgi:hypothetical protein